jgi:hypothetical protein
MAKTSRPTRAPNKALYLTDYARSAWDIGALLATLPALARAPRGDGHAVLVIPGLGASDMSTLILRRFLSTLGYATYGWELGRNIGPTARVVSGLPERLHEFRARRDGPVSVIGWTSPPASQRTSRSTLATSASATIPPHCGSLPTD